MNSEFIKGFCHCFLPREGCPSPAPAWGHSHGRQSPTNFCIRSPSHGLRCSQGAALRVPSLGAFLQVVENKYYIFGGSRARRRLQHGLGLQLRGFKIMLRNLGAAKISSLRNARPCLSSLLTPVQVFSLGGIWGCGVVPLSRTWYITCAALWVPVLAAPFLSQFSGECSSCTFCFRSDLVQAEFEKTPEVLMLGIFFIQNYPSGQPSRI